MTVIFVVATIVVFLTADWVVQRLKKSPAGEPARVVHAEAPYPLRFPEGVFFAKSHTWLSLFPSGRVRLGVDDFVGSVLETPEVTFMRSAGEKIAKADPILVLSEGDHRLVIRAPIAGEIVAANSDLEKEPGLMREMPFSKGWAYTIQPKDPQQLRALMLGRESRSWMLGEFRRLRDLLSGIGMNAALVPAAIQDGGPPVPGVLKQLDAGAWERFEQEFLQVQ